MNKKGGVGLLLLMILLLALLGTGVYFLFIADKKFVITDGNYGDGRTVTCQDVYEILHGREVRQAIQPSNIIQVENFDCRGEGVDLESLCSSEVCPTQGYERANQGESTCDASGTATCVCGGIWEHPESDLLENDMSWAEFEELMTTQECEDICDVKGYSKTIYEKNSCQQGGYPTCYCNN